MWWFSWYTARRYQKEIEILSRDIEKRIYETLAPIDEKIAPKEIRPLINAINRLVAYFEDRSSHEQEFSANASHELRTPLAGIRLQTEIAMGTDDKEIQQRAHRNVLVAIDHNERLIEQLLIMARLVADRVELAMEKVNLLQLTTHVIRANLKNLAKEKHIDLKLEFPHNLTVIANEESIAILLHNLICNAINYIPNGSKIVVRAGILKNGKVLLSVADNGPGIPRDKCEMVLRRFQKTISSEKSSSGLGLAIVKRICDLHHAMLELGQASKSGGLKVTMVFNH